MISSGSGYLAPQAHAVTLAGGFHSFCEALARTPRTEVRGADRAAIRVDFADPRSPGFVELQRLNQDLLLLAADFTPAAPLELEFAGENWIRLHFRLAGDGAIRFEAAGPRRLAGALSTVFFHPEGTASADSFDAARVRIVTLWCRWSYLQQLLEEQACSLLGGRSEEELTREGAAYFRRGAFTPAMARLVGELQGAAYEGVLRRSYLQAKSTELICELAHSFGDERSSGVLPVRLSARDERALNDIRRVLVESYARPPRIADLARRFGMNRNKLSYGFEHLFRQTIGEFCAAHRLTAARELIERSDLPLSLIAERVGYGSAANFSTAFRRHFGLAPSALRRRSR